MVLSDAQYRLQAILGLTPQQASRALNEILDVLRMSVDEYIGARHAELRSQGESNAAIFDRIASELPVLRFKAPPLTSRQIRRRIYG